jgi:hypothetical protein
MGVGKKNGDRFYDFVDSEVQCLFYKNRSAENTQIPSPWLFLSTLAIFIMVASHA